MTNPATHRRRTGWLRRTGRRLAGLVLVLATVAAGNVLLTSTPTDNHLGRFFIRSGDLGERVQGQTFAVTVSSVRGGPTVVSDRGEEYRTNGIWVLVRTKVVASEEAQRLSYVAVRDRFGRVFDASSRFQQPIGDGYYLFQPDITVEGEILFEVPRDAVAGLHLQLHKEPIASSRHQTVVEIDLRLTEDTLAGWLAQRDPPRLMEPEVTA